MVGHDVTESTPEARNARVDIVSTGLTLRGSFALFMAMWIVLCLTLSAIVCAVDPEALLLRRPSSGTHNLTTSVLKGCFTPLGHVDAPEHQLSLREVLQSLEGDSDERFGESTV